MTKGKILVVDDDENLLRLISYNLEKAGYSVATCSDGEKALEEFLRFEPDLVILDVLMPKLDGFKVCEKIRKYPAKKHIPIIIASAIYRRVNYQEEAKKIGADYYLVKPFDPQKLIKKVEELLRDAGETG
ncbi:MAG: response regulator [Acidobacteria bacterium]|nr:response regulator [Acidobacteriota bacterium]